MKLSIALTCAVAALIIACAAEPAPPAPSPTVDNATGAEATPCPHADPAVAGPQPDRKLRSRPVRLAAAPERCRRQRPRLFQSQRSRLPALPTRPTATAEPTPVAQPRNSDGPAGEGGGGPGGPAGLRP